MSGDDARRRDGVAVITGAGSGIGAACAIALARTAGTVVVHYSQNADGAEQTASSVRLAGAKAVVVRADLATEDGARSLIGSALEVGEIDVLVNNAGRTRAVPFADLDGITEQDWENAFRLNVLGAFWCARAAASSLIRREGSIVNIATASAGRAAGSSIPYALSKAALVQLSTILAASLAPVRVNTVSPGAIRTEWLPRILGADAAARQHRTEIARIPLERIAEPSDVADAVVGLVGARYVTGQNVLVDGGRAVLY